MGNKAEEIIICPTCKGQENVRYCGKDAKVCFTCDGKGRVWRVTEIYIEKIAKLYPKRLIYKGL